MERSEIIELLGEDEEIIFLEPAEVFDAAILGVCRFFGSRPRIAYDYEEVIEGFVRGGMTRDEAVEFFEYNTIGAYVGESTPVFIFKNLI